MEINAAILRSTLIVGCVAIAATAIAQPAQPKMQEAFAALQAARVKLAQAEHDKGGHREAALRLVDQALQQVREGLAVGATH